MNNNVYELDFKSTFTELSDVEAHSVDGGLVVGVLLGAVNGYCAGLACAAVLCWTTPNWTWTDTKNCMATGAVLGAYAGAFIPV